MACSGTSNGLRNNAKSIPQMHRAASKRDYTPNPLLPAAMLDSLRVPALKPAGPGAGELLDDLTLRIVPGGDEGSVPEK